MNSLVSVVIPAYNSEDYISEAIESVLAQTYKNIELIIVNDGSTDTTLDVINKYAEGDSRIIILDKENGGVSSARNLGFSVAKGDYIALLDSDDICSVDRIEKQIHAMQEKSLDVCSGSMTTFGNVKKNKLSIYPESDSELKFNLLFFGRTIPCPAAMISKSIVKTYKFRTNMNWAEDYAYWLNLLLDRKNNIRFGNLSGSLVNYRVHEEQATKRLEDKNRKVITMAVYEGLEKIGVDIAIDEVYMHYDVVKCSRKLDKDELDTYLNFLSKISNVLSEACDCKKHLFEFFKKLIVKQSHFRYLIMDRIDKEYGYSLSVVEKIQMEISVMKKYLKRERL